MPASDSAMGSPSMGMGSSSGTPGNSANNLASNPAVIGLLAFGMTAILFGLSLLPKPYGNGFAGFSGVAETELILGGLVLILAGVIGILRGHPYWGTIFLGYGAFWASLAYVGGIGGVLGYGASGFAVIWLLFTLTFLISSFKHGWGSFFGLLFLFVAFILLIIFYWQVGAATSISSGEHWAVGGLWIATGLLWWYGATAMLTNHTYDRKILPV
jgi:uncharacterized protein